MRVNTISCNARSVGLSGKGVGAGISPIKVAWGVTGSGDHMPETIQVVKGVVERGDARVTVFLSKSAAIVVRWYGLWDSLSEISPKVMIEEGANVPFIAGPLQLGKYKFLLVAPATANTVAKIVNGIADSLVTNAVAQAQKGNVPIYILPVDQETESGKITTVLPTGEMKELAMRDVDLANLRRLKAMNGIEVITRPSEIELIMERYKPASR